MVTASSACGTGMRSVKFERPPIDDPPAAVSRPTRGRSRLAVRRLRLTRCAQIYSASSWPAVDSAENAPVSIHVVRDQVFTPVKSGDTGHRSPLVVHGHLDCDPKQLVIFLHGLGGRRYGTWGELPRFIYEDCPLIDVGLYDYRSGLRGLMPWSAVNLEELARELADTIRDSAYGQVVLIGHSMGGLLAKAVVKDLLESGVCGDDGTPTISRVAGLLLVATPQAGSLRVPLFAMLTRDGRALRAHSRLATGLSETFSNRIDTLGSANGRVPGKHTIPVFGLIGSRDAWVDRLSSCFDLPRSQTKNVRESHTSIVKPRARTDGGYSWLQSKVLYCFSISAGGRAGIVNSTVHVPMVAEDHARLKLELPNGVVFSAECTESVALQIAPEIMRYLKESDDV